MTTRPARPSRAHPPGPPEVPPTAGEAGGPPAVGHPAQATAWDATARQLMAVVERMGDAFVLVDRDWRIRYQNAEAVRINGGKPAAEVIGRTLWEEWSAVLGTEVERQHRRALTDGVPVHLEHRYLEPPDHDVWLDIRTYPLDEGLGIFFRDITEQTWAELDRALVGELDERIRLADDADALLAEVVRVVGTHVRADRCFFIEVDQERDRGLIRHDYCRGVPSVAGEYRLSEYSPVTRAELEAGRTVVVADSWHDPRTAERYERTYEPVAERAFVGVPLRRDGAWRAILSVTVGQPRRWQPREVALLEAVAERAWLAIERLRLTAELRQTEERLNIAQAAGGIGVWDWQAATGETFWSETMWAIYGHPAAGNQKPSSDFWESCIHPEDRERVAEEIERALAAPRRDYRDEFRIVRPDGAERWVEAVARVERDATGAPVRMSGVNVDVTARKRAEERQRFLVEAGRVLAASLDERTELEQIARLVVPALADWCAIDLAAGDGLIHRLTVVHRDPAKAGIAAELQRRYPVLRPTDEHTITRVLRSGRTWIDPAIAEERFVAQARDPHHLALLQGLGFQAEMVVPLVARDRVLGVLTFVLATADRAYGPEEQALAEELARSCAQAIDLARLHEQALASEARYRTIVETANEGIWYVDAAATTLYVNDRMADLLGYPAGEIVGRAVPDYCFAEDLPQARSRIASNLAGNDEQFDFRFRRRDGGAVEVLATTSPVRDGGGRIVGALGMFSDITDRKRAEAALRLLAEAGRTLAASLDYEETLRRVARLAVPSLADYCFVDLLRPDGTLHRVAWAHADPAWQAWFDETMPRFVPPRIGDDHPIPRTVATGQPVLAPAVDEAWMERVAYSPDHLEFMRAVGLRSVMSVPLVARNRTIGTIVLCSTDASGRRYADADLPLVRAIAERAALAVDNARLYRETREAEMRIRRLLDAGVMGVIVADGERIREANDPFLAMVGYSRAELAAGALRWAAMTPPEYAERDARGIAELRERGVCTPFEKEYVRKDGSRVPILIGSAELERDPPLWICFVLDLTEQKRAEAERLAFVDQAAHDLRNPLASIKAQAQLLRRRLRRGQAIEPATVERGLGAIDAATTRMMALIDELMDAAHLRAGRHLEFLVDPVDLADLTRRCAEEAAGTTSRHDLRVEAVAESLVGTWDRARLERVVQNLLANAIKYSPDGGEVVLRLERENDPAGGWAVLRVLDRGIGVPAADLPHLFERFRRGGNVAGRITGVGIGLAGAKQIVEQHGGTIAIASRERAGTTVTVRLPLDPGAGRRVRCLRRR